MCLSPEEEGEKVHGTLETPFVTSGESLSLTRKTILYTTICSTLGLLHPAPNSTPDLPTHTIHKALWLGCTTTYPSPAVHLRLVQPRSFPGHMGHHMNAGITHLWRIRGWVWSNTAHQQSEGLLLQHTKELNVHLCQPGKGQQYRAWRELKAFPDSRSWRLLHELAPSWVYYLQELFTETKRLRCLPILCLFFFYLS